MKKRVIEWGEYQAKNLPVCSIYSKLVGPARGLSSFDNKLKHSSNNNSQAAVATLCSY